MEAHPCERHATLSGIESFSPDEETHPMANSSFETFRQGGKAIDEAAEKTGEAAGNLYDKAKTAASDAYDSASEHAGDAVARMQDGVADLDDMVGEQVGRHPKAMVALGVGIGFALGVLFASSRTREPSWRDYAKW
jgi:ElaB/YqjD/DUF883 family membrane-anchored ribosome-binding protein